MIARAEKQMQMAQISRGIKGSPKKKNAMIEAQNACVCQHTITRDKGIYIPEIASVTKVSKPVMLLHKSEHFFSLGNSAIGL